MRNLALVLTLATVTPLLAQSSSLYRITHTYTLSGDGGWDYIVPDPPNHRLFIGRQNRVMKWKVRGQHMSRRARI